MLFALVTVSAGCSGSAGASGSAGVAGSAGSAGVAGVAGCSGSAGASGSAGVAGVSGGNGGGGGLCGSGQLGHGLGPQHLAAHGAGVGLDALTLRGGGGGDLALALRMLGVHGEGDGNGVAEAVGGRQGLDALGSGNGELTVHQLHGLAVEGHALQIRVGDGDLCRQAVGTAVHDALHRRSRLVDELRAHLGAGIRQAAAVVALSRLRAVIVIGGVVVVDVVGEAVTHGLLIEILRTSVGLALVQLAGGISEVAAAIRAVPISNIPAKTTKEFNKVVCAPYSKRDKIHRPR